MRQVLDDPCFRRGFDISTQKWTINGEMEPPFRPGRTWGGDQPVWKLAQWQSMYDLMDGEQFTTETGIGIRDAGKTVVLDRLSADTCEVTLEQRGSVEFPSERPDSWPHLILQQGFEPCSLADCTSLRLNMSFELLRAELVRPEAAIADGALFSLVTVLNNGEDGVWFQLDLYDWRWTDFKENVHIDTGKPDASLIPIYTIPTSAFLKEPYVVEQCGNVQSGGKLEIDIDLLPLMSRCIDACIQKGCFHDKARAEGSDGFSFDFVGIGWENWGHIDLVSKISQVSIQRD